MSRRPFLGRMETRAGYKWIDYADVNGQFHGEDWQNDAQWCAQTADRLHVGDLNGDGRDDWLCHNASGGYKRADYADSFGVFYGTDWYGYVNWCTHTGAQLH
ncbi:hypothetical protein NR798_25150 [Archangium gephyra]|uniref:hypothetical protein n=1 Tax=Archangium gephyra TaxID=48 RepID=UPI0035D48682